MEPLLRSLFRASSALPRLGAGLLTRSRDAPREALRDVLRAVQESAEGLRRMTPGVSNRAVLQEIQNKLEAFEHFRFATTFIRDSDDPPLGEQVLRAGELPTYRRIWVVEGLGYAHGERADDIDSRPPLLDPPWVQGVTDGHLLPLSTGMGLALARRALVTEGSGDVAPTISDGVSRFARLCARHARPGYEDAVFEGLGLIARGLRPEELTEIDAYLAANDPARVATLWHGVGRGMFFAPTQTLPGAASLWIAVERTRLEAPHDTGRRNALAGLAWATTLVHIRHPRILESFVTTYGERLGDDEQSVFASGVSCACVLWSIASGYERHLAGLHTHRPATGRKIWERLVTRAIDEVEARRQAVIASGAPGALFRHSDGL
jgi:hypothetical protein